MYDILGYNTYQNKLTCFSPTKAELLSYPEHFIGKNVKVYCLVSTQTKSDWEMIKFCVNI